MARPEKVQAVTDIREGLEGSEAVFLTEYRGLSVQAVQDLRRALRDSGAEYKVVKMTLAKLAAGDAGIEGLDEHLSGPTALAFANGDPVATAKALKDFSKDHEVFVLKAGYLSGNILSPEEISRLAEIEPREILLAKIAGAARAPLYSAAGMFASFTRDAASMFSQLLDKKESGEPADGDDAEEASLPADEPTETDEPAETEETAADESAGADEPAETEETAADAADESTEADEPTETDEPAKTEETAADAAEEE